MPKEPYYERKISKVKREWKAHLEHLAKKGKIKEEHVATIHKIFLEEAAKRDKSMQEQWGDSPRYIQFWEGISPLAMLPNKFKEQASKRIADETGLGQPQVKKLVDEWEEGYQETLVPAKPAIRSWMGLYYYEPKRHLKKSLWK